jgi:hypothetical protein
LGLRGTKTIKLNLETGKRKKSGNQTVRVERCEDDQASLETGKQRTVPTRELGLRGMKPIQLALKQESEEKCQPQN